MGKGDTLSVVLTIAVQPTVLVPLTEITVFVAGLKASVGPEAALLQVYWDAPNTLSVVLCPKHRLVDDDETLRLGALSIKMVSETEVLQPPWK